MMQDRPPDAHSPQTRIRRVPQNAVYDQDAIYAILDEAMIGHFGFVDEGHPYVVPMIYGRTGDKVYIHGSVASRLMRLLADGCRACMTVTLLDGLVLARSLYHHSMNYRSVVAMGRGVLVDDPQEKMEALRTISDHILPDRWPEARLPNDREMKSTLVVSFALDSMSAKVRSGPPGEEPEDYTLSVWAGVLPLSLKPGVPIDDPQLRRGVPLPDSVLRYVGKAEG